jgi:hypothetical protein
MSNFRSASVDGFGERDDIALEQDKQQGIARDNAANNLNRILPDMPFAESGEGLKVSDIVKNLVQRGGGQALYFNHQIEWDMDLGEAKENAALTCIIPEGWNEPVTSSDQIVVDGSPRADQYEITITLAGDIEIDLGIEEGHTASLREP